MPKISSLKMISLKHWPLWSIVEASVELQNKSLTHFEQSCESFFLFVIYYSAQYLILHLSNKGLIGEFSMFS
jgi:hypothetical protein